MRFISTLVALMAISAAAHSLTLDSGKFSGVLTEDVVVADCDNDGYHCNNTLKNLSKTVVVEEKSTKTDEVASLDLKSVSKTTSTGGATLFDIAAVKIELDLSQLPEKINPGAMAQGQISVLVVDGDSRGASYRSYKASCTVISKKQFSCKTGRINGTANQLNLRLQVAE